jgi:hypothetical protein
VRPSAFPNSGVLTQGLSPTLFCAFTARLKSCPDTKQVEGIVVRRKSGVAEWRDLRFVSRLYDAGSMRGCFTYQRLARRSTIGDWACPRPKLSEGSEPSGGGPITGCGPVSAERAVDPPGLGGAVLRSSIRSPLTVPE